jgi:hypothetical protein
MTGIACVANQGELINTVILPRGTSHPSILLFYLITLNVITMGIAAALLEAFPMVIEVLFSSHFCTRVGASLSNCLDSYE